MGNSVGFENHVPCVGREGSLLATKTQCLQKKNSVWVKGYSRRGYRRSDGVYVKPTRVGPHCRTYSEEEVTALSLLKDGRPEGWHGIEEFKKWSHGEKTRTLNVIKKLPHKRLKDISFNIYRVKKDTSPTNPGKSIPIPRTIKSFCTTVPFLKNLTYAMLSFTKLPILFSVK